MSVPVDREQALAMIAQEARMAMRRADCRIAFEDWVGFAMEVVCWTTCVTEYALLARTQETE